MKTTTLAVTLIILHSSIALAADYSKEMKKALRNSIGEDFGRYQFLGTPISNFGVGTMYPKAAQSETFDIKTGGLYGDPETWWAKEYDKDEKAKLLGGLRPGGSTGRVSFKYDKNKKFDLAVVLPALFQLLSANGGVNYAKKIQVQVTAKNVENRLLNWPTLDDYRTDKRIKESVLRHLDAKDFVITIGDILLYEYTATLVVDRNLSVDAKAKLDAAWKLFAKDSSVGFTFSDAETGTYAVKAPENTPLIAAVFVGVPPPGALRAVKKTEVQATPLAPRVLRDLTTTKSSDVPLK